MITSASNHNAAASDRSAMPPMVRLARNGVRGSFAGPLVKSTYVKLTGNARPGEVMRGGPDVSFGEVWNILASLAVRRRWLRQASGCRSFFLSPSILGNDNVIYYSLIRLRSGCKENQIGRA